MKVGDRIDWQSETKRSLFATIGLMARDYVTRYPVSIAFAVLLLIASGLMEGIGILSLLPVVETLISDGESQSAISQVMRDSFVWLGLPTSLPMMLLVIVVMILGKSVFLFFANIFVGRIGIELNKVLRIELLRALMGARWGFFTSESTGRLTNALLVEANQTSKVADSLMALSSFTIQTTVYVGAAFLISWQLTLAAIAASAFMLLILWVFISLTRRFGLRATALQQSYAGRIVEWLEVAKPLKAMAREDRIVKLLEGETDGVARAQTSLMFATQGLRALQEPITVIFVALGLLAAIQFTDTTATSLIVMAGLFARTVGRINGIQTSFRRLARQESPYFAFRRRLESVEQEAETPFDGHGKLATRPATFESAISLEGVDHVYEDAKSLDQVSLTINRGEIVAIVGPSGAGKSTVLDLVSALLVPTQGRVLVDGVDLRELDRRQWRHLIGYVPQDCTLFHTTVRENLTLGDESIADSMVEQSLRQANALDFVESRLGGLDAIVGERGQQISGGQRQRLAIARALIHQPKLLLLDEATSSMDSQTERAFCEVLSKLAPEITIVAISHRPAIEAVADVVYRLEQGRVVARQEAANEDLRARDSAALS